MYSITRPSIKEFQDPPAVNIKLSRQADQPHWRITKIPPGFSLHQRGSLKIGDQCVPSTPGTIIGSDHGKEVWTWRLNPETIIYDRPDMLEIIEANCRVRKSRVPDLRDINDFQPVETQWLKILVNSQTLDFINHYQNWISSIPEVLVELHHSIDPFAGKYRTYR